MGSFAFHEESQNKEWKGVGINKKEFAGLLPADLRLTTPRPPYFIKKKPPKVKFQRESPCPPPGPIRQEV